MWRRILAIVLLTVTLAQPCMAAGPVFVGFAQGSVASGASFTVSSTLSAGTILSGDQLVLIDCYSGVAPSFSGGNSWGTVHNSTNASAPNNAWVTRAATSSEPASYTISGGASTFHTGVLLDYRTTNNTVDVSSTPNNQTTSTTPATLSITTTIANDVWIAGVCWGGTASMSSAPAGGLTQRVNIPVSANPPFGLWLGDAIINPAGATGAPTGTLSVSSPWDSFSVSLEPFTCPTLTNSVVAPNGAGSGGVCIYPPATAATVTTCYKVAVGDTCTTQVTDQTTTCSPPSAPAGGGSNVCDVACSNSGSGCSWLDD